METVTGSLLQGGPSPRTEQEEILWTLQFLQVSLLSVNILEEIQSRCQYYLFSLSTKGISTEMFVAFEHIVTPHYFAHSLAGRGQHVPQVSEVGCGCKSWNGIGLGIDLSPSSTPDACKPSGSKTPSSAPGALNRKLSKSVTGIFFRYELRIEEKLFLK